MRALKISFFSGLGFSVLFGLSSFFYFKNLEDQLLLVLFGFFIGLLAAPEIAPKAFKKAALLQLLYGLCAGAVIGWFFNLSIELLVVAAACGAFVGWLAPFWVKHIQAP